MNIREKVIGLVRGTATSLPTLPVVINNIITMSRSRKTTAGDLAEFISNDQSLSARVLKIANSPYYARPGKISSITRAIILVGFQEIISIALGSGIINALGRGKISSLIDPNEFWKHSICAGFASRIAEKLIRASADESLMLAGLLHDIGKVVFLTYFPDEYHEVLRQHQEDLVPLHAAEAESLGIDHCETAYLLMKQWHFPDAICVPVRFHHDLSSCPFEFFSQAMTVHLADYLSHRAEIGCSGNLNPGIREEMSTSLHLSEQRIEELAGQVRAMRSQVDGFLEALS